MENETSYENSFIKQIHEYASSQLFFIGILLFSIGTGFSLLTTGFFGILFSALPIIGVWLIWLESKNLEPNAHRKGEKTLMAILLFKITTIAMIVISIIAVAIIPIGLAFVILVEPIAAWILLIILPIIAYIAFYYISVIKVLNSIRDNIKNNTFKPIYMANLFLIFSFIGIGFGILLPFITVSLVSFFTVMAATYASFARDFGYFGFPTTGIFGLANILVFLAAILPQIGMLLILIVFRKLHLSLKK